MKCRRVKKFSAVFSVILIVVFVFTPHIGLCVDGDGSGSIVNVQEIPAVTGLDSLVGDGTDETDEIQAIIDYYAETYNCGHVVLYFPKTEEHYGATKIGLKNSVSIISDGAKLCALESSEPDFIYNAEDGPTISSSNSYKIQGLCIVGNSNNVGQNCMNLTAKPKTTPAYDGGFWHCQFKDMVIYDFSGVGLKLYADNTDSPNGGDLANQYLYFENINIYRSSASSKCLEITGQLAQTVFRNCEFNGTINGLAGTNADIKSLGTANDQVFGALRFENCTFQTSNTAIKADYVGNLVLDGCWFEQLIQAIVIDNETKLTVRNSHFASVGNDTGTGYGISVGDDCTLMGSGNDIVGPHGYFIVKENQNTVTRGIDPGYISGGISNYLIKDTSPNINLTSTTLNAYSHKIINNTTNADSIINTIDSSHTEGGQLTIRNAANNILTIKSNGNIILPNKVDCIALLQNDTITLMKISPVGDSVKWIVLYYTGQGVSYTNLNTNGDMDSTAGYVGINSSLSASNNILTISGDGSGSSPSAVYINMAINAGDVIYCSAEFKPLSSPSQILAFAEFKESDNTVISNSSISSQTPPIANTKYTLSGKITAPANTAKFNLWLQNIYSDASSADGTNLQVREALCVNLTEIFGTGNEPSVEWCNSNLQFVE